VLKFGHAGAQTCLKSSKSHPVPTSATFLAVVSWEADGGPWEPIAAVSHDVYWSIRFYSSSRDINMHVRNEQVPRVAVPFNKPHVIVCRVDDATKKSKIWVWDITGEKWIGKEERDTQGIPSGGDEVITLGRATDKTHEWMHGELAAFTMWDSALSDSDTEALVRQYARNYGQNRADVNCEGTWSACTSACEKAAQRTFTETQAKSGNGLECPTTVNCEAGVDECLYLMPVCVNYPGWNAGWGVCSTYSTSARHSNFPWCSSDRRHGYKANQVCPECQECKN